MTSVWWTRTVGTTWMLSLAAQITWLAIRTFIARIEIANFKNLNLSNHYSLKFNRAIPLLFVLNTLSLEVRREWQLPNTVDMSLGILWFPMRNILLGFILNNQFVFAFQKRIPMLNLFFYFENQFLIQILYLIRVFCILILTTFSCSKRFYWIYYKIN